MIRLKGVRRQCRRICGMCDLRRNGRTLEKRQDDFLRAFLSQLLLHDRHFRGEGESMRTYNKETNVRFIAVTGVLSAAAFVLMLIEIPVPMLIPPFIKFDFSDLPALIGAFAMGPLCGILIEFIKNLLHTFVSGSFGVGELSNFMLGAVFVGIAGLIYGMNRTKKGAVTGSLVGALAMALFSLPSNYFIVYPVYYNFMPKDTILAAYQAILPSVKSIGESLLLFNVPFTFVKGMIDVAVTLICHGIYHRRSYVGICHSHFGWQCGGGDDWDLRKFIMPLTPRIRPVWTSWRRWRRSSDSGIPIPVTGRWTTGSSAMRSTQGRSGIT